MPIQHLKCIELHTCLGLSKFLISNKKILLCDHKRHTAHRVASTRPSVQGGGGWVSRGSDRTWVSPWKGPVTGPQGLPLPSGTWDQPPRKGPGARDHEIPLLTEKHPVKTLPFLILRMRTVIQF